MKDAPINLPPHWYVAETGTVHVSYVRDYADQYARAAVLADRAGREATQEMHLAYDALDRFLRNNLDDTDYASYSAYLETLWPDTPAAPSPAEPPAAPVKQEPVARVDANDDGMWADILPNVNVKVGQFLYAHPDADLRAELAEANEDYSRILADRSAWRAKAERAEAERDSLRKALEGYVLAMAVGGGDDKDSVMASIRAADNAARAALKGTP